MKIRVVGSRVKRSKTSARNALRMIHRGIARWVSDTEIVLIEDHRVRPDFTAERSRCPIWRTIVPMPEITDAFPGHPVIPIIGYDLRTPGAYQ